MSTVEICKEKGDVIIVLDSSSSIGKDNFAIHRKFIQSFTENFELGEDGFKFGVVVFGFNAVKLFDLKDYSTPDSLKQVSRVPLGNPDIPR